mgnify:CR=1 FL=1
MEKKNKIIIKTFEQFKSDNENYYSVVLEYLTHIVNMLKLKNYNYNELQKSIKDVDNTWQIESDIDFYDLKDYNDNQDDIIYIHNKLTSDIITIDIQTIVTKVNESPGTEYAPDTKDITHETDIEHINFYNNEQNENYVIKITPEIEQLIINIIRKINK